LEPLEDAAVVRLRIDGILHDEFSLTKMLHDRLIALIKIRSHMRTDEHRAPQDGRDQFASVGGGVDVRVSIMPTSNGEKAVLRLLSSESHKLTLEQLGFSKKDFGKVERAVRRPWGMILATGPTGSGKTTTIYAILEILNQRGVNISTIEDPVEFRIPGVNQSQVDRVAKVTFANGLRAIVRQDPDIIMVGEIRDEETAKIAVNAALTGHKLLSTLHTNNAATTIPRLLDMQVEPFLVASTLIVAIAQRLLRRVCPSCSGTKVFSKKEAAKVLPEEYGKRLFVSASIITLAAAVGCKECSGTGYRGRVGIYEVMEVSSAIQELIVSRASSDHIEAQAMREGMTSLLDDGVTKVLQRETTIEELIRVMFE
jgi:type IV pilus assembly protein PilB